MRRLLAATMFAAAMLLTAPAVHADRGSHHGHHHHGHHHHHHGHHRHFGHSHGWYGGGLSLSIGLGRPYYGYGLYRPAYCGPYDYGYGGYGYGGYGYGLGLGYGYGGYGSGLGLGYGYSPYGTYYRPSANYLEHYLPPFYEPSELNWGPLAVKQFLGLDRNFALGPLREPPLRLPLVPEVPLADAADKGDGPLPRIAEKPIRTSSPLMRRKAERYVAEGDALFRTQKFHSALQKYKLAASAAPDVAENHWRQGHALIATSNFDLAAPAFKRAIALGGDVRRGGFSLNDLYGTAAIAKGVHLEQLAEHALEHEASADAYFLLGVQLTFDGQPERAQKFFVRALDLSGMAGGHIAAFFESADAPLVESRPADPPPVTVSTGTDI